MKKLLTILLVGVAPFAGLRGFPSSARAADFVYESGNTLKTKCASLVAADQTYCAGYIAAIVDAENRGGVAGFNACVPRAVPLGQEKDVFIRFVERHPEIRHYEASSLIANALEDAFPCSK